MHKGRVKKWDADRGFGFIATKRLEKDVFVHISEFKRCLRPPIVGDVIFFEIDKQKDGKFRAVACKIEGVAENEERTKAREYTRRNKPITHKKRSKASPLYFVFLLLLGMGLLGYQYYQESFSQVTGKNSARQAVVLEEQESSFICDGRQHCSEMSSCEEAEFFNRNCPDTKMDGDNDGIPCERQLCGY